MATVTLPATAAWSVRSSVEASFRIGLDNFPAFFTVALLFAAPGFVLEMRGIGGIPKFAADLAGNVAAYICILCGTLHTLEDRVLTLQQTVWQINRPGLRSLLLLGAVQTIAIVAAAVLFVVPALYLLALWSVTMPVMLVEGTGQLGTVAMNWGDGFATSPSVVSRAVWCSISALSSPPSRTMTAEIHSQTMKPTPAPSDP